MLRIVAAHIKPNQYFHSSCIILPPLNTSKIPDTSIVAAQILKKMYSITRNHLGADIILSFILSLLL